MIAYILCDCMREYEGCTREQVASEFLACEPVIGEEPVDRDDTARLRLSDTEDTTLFEHTVVFDVRLDAIRSIMRASSMALSEVLDLMGIPKEELPRYEVLLSSQPA